MTKNLTDERESFKASIRERRRSIEQLMVQRERDEAEGKVHTRRYQERLEELKLQGMKVAELQKKMIASGSRLKQQQNLYEAVRSDRNVYSKNLIETQACGLSD
ncbi:unnamed protein product [Discosporangium mesarthrocarpum]